MVNGRKGKCKDILKCVQAYFCELQDVLSSFVLCSPPLLLLLLTDEWTGLRFLMFLVLQSLYCGPQTLQLSAGCLSLWMESLSQSGALSGLATWQHNFIMQNLKRNNLSMINGSNRSGNSHPPPGRLLTAAASVWPPCPCWALCTSPLSGPQSSASAALSWQPCAARSTAWTPLPCTLVCMPSLPTIHALWPEETRQHAPPPAERREYIYILIRSGYVFITNKQYLT